MLEMNDSIFEADSDMDATGLICPEPVMLLHNKFRELCSGATRYIKATAPSTQRDIPKFCAFLGHELLDQQYVENQYHYLIRKGYA